VSRYAYTENKENQEKKNVRATFFARVDSGTKGRVEPPKGAKIVLDSWGEKIDALVSKISENGKPTCESPVTKRGKIVTTTMDADGNWKLSGRPTTYPIAIIYAYEISLPIFKSIESLESVKKV